MPNSTELRFGWNYDSGLGLDAIFTCSCLIEVFITVPVQCWILVILFLKPNVLRADIRRSNIADQVATLLYELMMCFLFQPYPIFPWPGIYCSGILCQFDLSSRVVSVILVSTFIWLVPIFLYLMIRLHNQVTCGSTSKFILSTRNQHLLMAFIILLFSFNVVCFGLLAVDAENSAELKKAPELAALMLRKGSILVIGAPGEPHGFRYVAIILYITIVLIVLLLTVLTGHSLHIIKNRSTTSYLSQKTHQVQDRLTIVFFSQMISVVIFFVAPLTTMIYMMTIDTSYWPPALLAATRATVIIALSLKPLTHSLIFLGKNPILRKQALLQMIVWLRAGGLVAASKRSWDASSRNQSTRARRAPTFIT